MGKKKAPAAPDPYATAQAQADMNADVARQQANLNRVNSYSPMGSVTYQNVGQDELQRRLNDDYARFQRGEYRPTYGNDRFGAPIQEAWRQDIEEKRIRDAMGGNIDRWEQRVTLSPEQQRLYDLGVQRDTQVGQLGLDMLPQVRQTLSAPMATDDPDARNRATQAILSRLEPQFTRDREGLEGRLIAQGFTPGSEGYNRAADELSRARTDTRLQADAVGSQESRAAAAFSNAIRGQRLSELGALFGLGGGAQMPQGAQAAPVGINSPDLMGGIMQNYQSRTGQVAAGNANSSALGGALASAAVTAAIVA
jgi:hypothetical protein